MFKKLSHWYVGGLIVSLPFLQTPFAFYPAHDIFILLLIGIAGILCVGLILHDRGISLSPTDLVIGVFVIVVILSACINGVYGSGVISILTGIFYLLIYLISRKSSLSQSLDVAILISAILQSLTTYGQFFGWISTDTYFHSVTGSFHNPAPLGCLLGLGLIVALYETMRSKARWLYIACAILLSGSLILTNSRAAWLAALVGCAYILIRQTRFAHLVDKYHLRIVLPICAIVLIAGLYLMRRDSADGRLLVWRVSSELVMQKPLLGHGPGSFQSIYPYAQADFFRKYPESHFTSLASDVSTPFNEGLSITVQLGLFGFVAFLTLILLAFRNAKERLMQAILLGLSIFGFFSYPFILPVFVVILIASLGCSASGKWHFTVPRWCIYTGGGFLIIAIIWYGMKLRSHAPITYCENKEYLGRNAKALYDRGEYDSLTAIFPRIPSSVLSTDLAKAYTIQGEYDRALTFARLSADMVPNRTMPYYLMFRIYERQNRIDSALYYARIVRDMPSKVENTTTLKAKREAIQYLNKHQ